MEKQTDSQMTIIKLVRGITYVVYAFTLIAVVSLTLAFFLLLFSANADTPFVKFVYQVAYDFGQPFRGIFPTRPVGETGYFSTTALFAIVMYLFFAAAINALIGYINLKMAKHQEELNKIESRQVKK
jgi:hypothetical protein